MEILASQTDCLWVSEKRVLHHLCTYADFYWEFPSQLYPTSIPFSCLQPRYFFCFCNLFCFTSFGWWFADLWPAIFLAHRWSKILMCPHRFSCRFSTHLRICLIAFFIYPCRALSYRPKCLHTSNHAWSFCTDLCHWGFRFRTDHCTHHPWWICGLDHSTGD